jgi:hypothetical protein
MSRQSWCDSSNRNWAAQVGRHSTSPPGPLVRVLGHLGRAVLVTLMACPIAFAGQQGRGPLPPSAPEMTPFQLQQLFDAMVVMQAQQALSLSETQYAQFLTRLRVLQESRRKYQSERTRLINELQRLTNARAMRPNVNETMVRERLTALQELESRHAAEVRRAYNGIDEVLDVYQQARFRVFEEQIERRKLELIGRARQNMKNGRREPPR